MEDSRKIGNDVRRLHNTIGIYCDQKRLSRHDDTPPMQGRTLGFLCFHTEREVYQKDIEQEFHISRATATKMLQSMEKKGMIVRETVGHDARLKRIRITESGRACHNIIKNDFKSLEAIMTRGMTEQEADQLAAHLQLALHNLEEELKKN